MEGFSPAGRAAGSSIVGPSGPAIGRIAGGLKWPQWSEESGAENAVGTGMGTCLEQPGPEQGLGRSGPGAFRGSRVMSSEILMDGPAIIASSRLTSRSRSDSETTRWLQTAQAERGAPRPWTRSTINAPAAHRASRSKRMDLITPSPSSARLRALTELLRRQLFELGKAKGTPRRPLVELAYPVAEYDCKKVQDSHFRRRTGCYSGCGIGFQPIGR